MIRKPAPAVITMMINNNINIWILPFSAPHLYTQGICIASIILLIIGGIVFVRIGSVTYKYSRAAIEILEQYKNDKVDEEEVMKKLSRFKEELEEIQTEGDDSKILSLKTDIFSIYTDFLVDKVTLSELDNYIFELKTRY